MGVRRNRVGLHHFVERPDGILKCDKCDLVTDRDYLGNCPKDQPEGQSKVSVRTYAEALMCIHNAGFSRVVHTECCGGQKTGHKVFTCDIHGECQLSQMVSGIMVCQKCSQFQPNETGELVNTRMGDAGASRSR